MSGKYCKTTNMKIAFSRSPCVLIGSKHENTRSPYVFIGFSNKIPVGTRDDIRQTHPNPWRPFRARVGQIYEIRRPFRARVVQIDEMKTRQALTFLTVSRPKCATVLRFCNTDVRKTAFFNDFTSKMWDSSTFLRHWCPENTVKQRFHEIFVRRFYVCATLMSGKHCKTTISRPKCVTALRFCNTDVWKTM